MISNELFLELSHRDWTVVLEPGQERSNWPTAAWIFQEEVNAGFVEHLRSEWCFHDKIDIRWYCLNLQALFFIF